MYFIPVFIILALIDQGSTLNVPSWLDWYNQSMLEVDARLSQALWNYKTNMTDENKEAMGEAEAKFSLLDVANSEQIRKYMTESPDFDQAFDATTVRLLRLIGARRQKLSQEDSTLKRTMHEIRNCAFDDNAQIECENLTETFRASRDYDERKEAWTSYHDKIGSPYLAVFKKYIDFSNKGARQGGFQDMRDYVLAEYEDPEIASTLESLWYELLPLYEELHAFVRRKLRNQYPGRIKNSIPTHLIGDMYSATWSTMYDSFAPYPEKPTLDVTNAMISQKYTPIRIYRLADDFYKSMGLMPAPQSLWDQSMFEEPNDNRTVDCHASAMDLYKYRDVRIKACTEIDMENLYVAHHEMGHIQNCLQYGHQPYSFRAGGRNPGFDEAVGDTIGLSVMTPEYLQQIGLFEQPVDQDQDINFLLLMALDKVGMIPNAYSIDQWRWDVYAGQIQGDWNNHFWDTRFKYMGIVPPVERKEGQFDPASIPHVAMNYPIISYFVAFILQFEFYEALCNAAGHQGHLHRCNFYGSKPAGDLLGNLMKLGGSVHWKDALRGITGRSNMSAGPLIRYFKPLMDWLKEANKDDCYGWGYQWPDEVMANLGKRRCEK